MIQTWMPISMLYYLGRALQHAPLPEFLGSLKIYCRCQLLCKSRGLRIAQGAAHRAYSLAAVILKGCHAISG